MLGADGAHNARSSVRDLKGFVEGTFGPRKVFWLSGLIILITLPFSSYPAATVVAFAGLVILGIYLVVREPLFVMKYVIPLLFSVLQLAGVILIESTTVELPELMTIASFNGAFPLLAMSRWSLIATLLLLDACFERSVSSRMPERPEASERESLSFIGLIAMVSLVIIVVGLVASAPPATMVGLDRFEYANGPMKGNIFLSLLGKAFPISAIAVVEAGRRRSINRAMGIAGVVLYVIGLLWVGNKFDALIPVLVLILLANFSRVRAFAPAVLTKLFGALAAAIVVLVGFAAVLQTRVEGGSPLTYLASRGAQQGQIWWAAMARSNGIHPEELLGELRFQVLNSPDPFANVGSDFGIFKMMYLTAPRDVVDAKLMTGSTYSEFGFALAHYYLGGPGAIAFGVLCGILIVLFTNGLIVAMQRNFLPETAILARFFALGNALPGQVLFHGFITGISLVAYPLFVAVIMMRRSRFSPLLSVLEGFGKSPEAHDRASARNR